MKQFIELFITRVIKTAPVHVYGGNYFQLVG